MAHELSREEIVHVADLAHIALTDEEIAQYQEDLGSILTYFEKLTSVDTDDVQEIGHITGMTDVYRRDDAQECDDETLARIMQEVPDEKDGYIAVKSVL